MSLGQSCIASVQLDAEDLDDAAVKHAASRPRRRRTFKEEVDEPVSIMQSLSLYQSACCTLLWVPVFTRVFPLMR